jgi:hypothetical protein
MLMLWMAFGHIVCSQDAPYLLEPLADSFAAEDVRVRLALLTAGGQLFFKRPPETQACPEQHKECMLPAWVRSNTLKLAAYLMRALAAGTARQAAVSRCG